MKHKVALVTGAASGIGRATALAFGRAAAHVVVADTNMAGGEETVAMIRQQGGDGLFVPADTSSASDVHALVARTVRAYGGLDVAFNNAGVEGELATTAECSEENWDRVLAINLKGVWLCMKYEIPHLLERGGGVIVNCASVAGLIGFPRLPAYVASKHAIVGLGKTAALEYARSGIRVNTVCPGVIQTPMIDRITGGRAADQESFRAGEPLGRFGTPEEVAGAVLWLCSESATFVTGVALPVDGGWVAQ